jgi:O-acetyl-ADP-ribose deacetylase (regulator of RNase III)
MATMEHRKGDLLAANAEALVNTVNTVGVMGKGVALQFKRAFPDNFKAYQRACKAGEVVPGRMFAFETGQLTGPRLIINFPTKRHWKGKARIEDIRTGLVDLVRVLRRYDIESVALPPLGCGNGGLNWSEVEPLIESSLAEVDANVLIYAPSAPPAAELQRTRTKRPKMTRVRAAVLAAFGAYRVDPSVTLTRLVAQKLAYLLQTDGEPLGLEFVKGDFGPYAETLNYVLQDLEGHYIVGYGDRTVSADIRLVDDAGEQAQAFLAADVSVDQHVDRVRELIEGLESPFGLELLTTVHWAATQEGAHTPDEARRVVEDWTPRKRKAFQDRHIAIAWDRLHAQGWLRSTCSTD